MTVRSRRHGGAIDQPATRPELSVDLSRGVWDLVVKNGDESRALQESTGDDGVDSYRDNKLTR